MSDVTIIKTADDHPSKSIEQKNLTRANRMSTIANIFIIALAIGIAIEFSCPIPTIANATVLRFVWIGATIIHAGIVIFSFVVHHRKKYLRLINGCIFVADVFLFSLTFANYNYFYFIPIILSTCYLDLKYTLRIGIASIIALIVADCLTHYFVIGTINLDTIAFTSYIIIEPGETISRAKILPYVDRLETLKNYMLEFMAVKIIIFGLLLALFIFFTSFAYDLLKKHAVSVDKENILAYELSAANSIQNSMLPTNFDEINKDQRFIIAAEAYPAREVGGDFYDFFKIDDNRLAIVMADVSGKGVPAALFMARSKTLIKDQLLVNHSPKKTLTEVNKMLCNNNNSHIFVTVWLGVLDLTNGHLTYVNAGHNYPVVITSDNKCSLLKAEKPQCFLAAFESTVYRQDELVLRNDETILLYTDGITEANNKKMELFGNDRLLKTMSENNNDDDVKSSLNYLKNKVDEFAGGAEQFDDITILITKYKGADKKIIKEEVKEEVTISDKD